MVQRKYSLNQLVKFMIHIFSLFSFIVISFSFTACKTSESSELVQAPPQSKDTIPIVKDTIPPIAGWTMVWNDEFSDSMIDQKKWEFEVNGDGGGNNEQQYYTARRQNARIDSGKLVIEARKETYFGKPYTSARLRSKFKGDWTYGHFEIRAKLPFGKGTWPAIWMLPSDWEYGGWPESGEIDIMEHVGYNQNVIHGSTHSKKYYFKINTQKTGTVTIANVSTQFHIYAIDWYADRIDFFVDGVKYFTSTNDGTGWEAWPFNKRFHFILNLAIGGDWGGAQGIDNSIFPQRMEIDYVRAYKKAE